MSNESQQYEEDTNEQNAEDYGVLTLANHILETLGQNFAIDDEEYLYK